MEKTNLKTKILPLVLTVIVILLNQITKSLIVKNILVNTIGFNVLEIF